MKVLCLHPFLSMRAVKEMSALHTLGHTITLVFVGLGCSVNNGYGDFWHKVLPLSENPFRGAYYFMRLFPRTYKSELEKIIKCHNFDIIHTYSMPDTLAVAAIRYAELPVVYDMRDLASGMDCFLLHDSKNKILNKLQNTFYKKVIKKFESEANKTSNGRIYSSPEMLNYIKNVYKIDLKRSIVLPNFQTQKNIPKKRKQKLSELDKGYHLVYVGNIAFDEYQRMIVSCKEIANQSIHLHIYPVGDSKVIEMFKNDFNNDTYIQIHDPLPISELLEEIQQYDFGILPYPPDLRCLNTNLTLPNKLFDYIAAGLPVACRNVISVANFVQKNHLGFIYNNVDELVSNVVKKNNKFKFEIEKFIMENHISSVINLYETVAGRL